MFDVAANHNARLPVEIPAPPASRSQLTLDAQARAFLAVEAEVAVLKARAELLRAPLLARMDAEGVKSLTVAGMGSLSYVAASTRTSLDGKAAEALLRTLGQDVPLTPSTVRASLRVNLNK
jgi:hypothetical protein